MGEIEEAMGEGSGIEARLAGFGSRGHVRTRRAGVSSEEPGREGGSLLTEADRSSGRDCSANLGVGAWVAPAQPTRL